MAGESGEREAKQHQLVYRAPVVDDQQPTAASDELRRRGKMWVRLMMTAFAIGICLNVLFDSTSTVDPPANDALYARGFRAGQVVGQTAVGLLELSLFAAVHRGKNWARWLLIAWLALAMVALVWLESRHPQFQLEGLVRKGVGMWALGMLLFSPSIRALVAAPPHARDD